LFRGERGPARDDLGSFLPNMEKTRPGNRIVAPTGVKKRRISMGKERNCQEVNHGKLKASEGPCMTGRNQNGKTVGGRAS